MGADSKIEWCHHTFNPWWGCEKIDPECKNCYAASFAKRTGHDVWGALTPRRFFGAKHWLEPIGWDRAAARRGVRERVFCASMADVFEDRRDLDEWRAYLWALIAETPNLDWMLLSKRPECMTRLAPAGWREGWPSNVWAGTTGGCQATIDDNVPELRKVPARVRFLSAEPLLEAVDIRAHLWPACWHWASPYRSPEEALAAGAWAERKPQALFSANHTRLRLVIAGAESGARPRAMSEEWIRSLRDQCTESATPFFYKQKLDGRNVVSLPLLDGHQWAQMPETRP